MTHSCMQNTKMIINNHKTNVSQYDNEMKDKCNCRDTKYYPLDGKCSLPNMAYQGKITTSQPNHAEKVYFGAAGKLFKNRL